MKRKRRRRRGSTGVNRRIIGPTTLSWSVDNGWPDVADNIATKEVAARVLTPASSFPLPVAEREANRVREERDARL